MRADSVLRSFALFLSAGWREVASILVQSNQFDTLIGDWMQSNWEILVEAVLFPGGSGFLEVYGDGADCNGASSRVFLPKAQPTHRIRCSPVPGRQPQDLGTSNLVLPEEMEFWGFVQWNGSSYSLEPPFNAVLLEGAENAVMSLSAVEFYLEPYPSPFASFDEGPSDSQS